MSILETIRGHEDLVKLSDRDLVTLCGEIREFLVNKVSKTGGHLASNLGAVELSVALETVFDSSRDRIVFDVGHQSYVHKLLTGRMADFDRLRQFGGMAGFPKPSESETDAFVAGHASTSVSIALGMARARTLMGESYHVAAVIGDGALTGGTAYEALNDAADSGEPLIVVLNDNEMSIDRNVGGLAKHLSRLRSRSTYLGAKIRYRKFMNRTAVGRCVYRVSSRIKRLVKRSLLPTTIFENMGFAYYGPIDGHDVADLIGFLRAARQMDCPVLLHIHTTKGYGYLPAEEDPSRFHGIGKFDPLTGMSASASEPTFSQAFGEAMVELAEKNDRLCAITAAMPGGTGLLDFKARFPNRFFDVGIAEEHAVSMAGGLAKQGMVPVFAVYSTFLQRSYDMILQDAALLHLHVIFAVDRAGLVGEDGETHHGTFDVGFLRQVPGMTVLCPASRAELKNMLRWAVEEQDGPAAVRYPRGSDRLLRESDFGSGDVVRHGEGEDIVLVTYGSISTNVITAAELLRLQGIRALVLRLLKIAPLPTDEIIEKMGKCRSVLVVEEVCEGSGIRDELAYALRSRIADCEIHGIDLGKRFATHGDLDQLYQQYGLDAASIYKRTREVLGK